MLTMPTCTLCLQTSTVELTETVDGELCTTCVRPYAECPDCGDVTVPAIADYCKECADDYATCVVCRDVVDVDETITEETDVYCESCHGRTFANCELCNGTVARGDVYTNDAGYPFCESCYQGAYTNCHSCDCEVETEYSYIAEDSYYCQDCYLDRFANCCECGEATRYEACEETGDGYICEDCGPVAEPFNGRQVYTETRSKRRFGIELETHRCNGWQSTNLGVFRSKPDGSIEGREFVSPPMFGDDGLAAIREFCRTARPWEVNASCGYHLHVDVSNLDETQLKRVAKAYSRFQAIWQSFEPSSRRSNGYCKALQWGENRVDDYVSFKCFASCQDRYQWFNVASYSRHGTFEIRLHTGTLNAKKVTNWVKAHTRFVDYFAEHDVDDVSFEALSAIWDDSELTEFYRQRAAKWGTTYAAPAPAPAPPIFQHGSRYDAVIRRNNQWAYAVYEFVNNSLVRLIGDGPATVRPNGVRIPITDMERDNSFFTRRGAYVYDPTRQEYWECASVVA